MARFSIRFLIEAADELEQANTWYESREPQTAQHWRQAVGDTLRSIRQTPKLWAADRHGCRSVLVDRFLYKIVYFLRGEVIEILAIAHTSRREGYWRKRLKKR